MRNFSNHKTFLVPFFADYQSLITKRTMFTTTKNLADKALTSNLSFLKKAFAKRAYASMHGGKFHNKSKVAQNPVTDSGNPIESDISGFHQNVVASVCKKPDCNVTNCADTKKTTPNPCGESPKYHQGPIANHPIIENKFIGTATSKTPNNMQEVVIDKSVNIKGKPKSQEVAVEKSSTTINPAEFKENMSRTKYLQDNNHTTPLLKALPFDTI
jgi:hypothetical protein